MPRLTNASYLRQRKILIGIRKVKPTVFLMRSYDQQLDIRGFYAPYKDMNDEQAIIHRRPVTEDHPTLPHRAGKFYVRLLQYVKKASKGPTYFRVKNAGVYRSKRKGRSVGIYALARPEANPQMMAMVSLDAAREMRGNDHEERAS